MPNIVSTLGDADVRKALDVSTSLAMTRNYADLELLIPCWTVETHTIVAAWGEFPPNSRGCGGDVPSIVVRGYGVICIVLSEKEEKTLGLLNVALKLSSKSIYTSFI